MLRDKKCCDMIIGTDNPTLLRQLGRIRDESTRSKQMEVETPLGWMIMGPEKHNASMKMTKPGHAIINHMPVVKTKCKKACGSLSKGHNI